MPESALHSHALGPADARDLGREVLLTDGLGGFTLGSPAGVPTRSSSGLNVAHQPPGLRRVMFVTALETLRVGQESLDLHAFEIAPGTLEGWGLSLLSGVRLDDLLPTREQLALGLHIRRRSVMPRHSGALVLLYDIDAPHLQSGETASLTLGGVFVDREMQQVHSATPPLEFAHLPANFSAARLHSQEVRVQGRAQACRIRLYAERALPLPVRPLPQRLHYRLDAARGAPDTDQAVRAALWEVTLRPGANRLALVIEGLGTRIADPWAAHAEEAARRAALVRRAWNASGVHDNVVATLSVAADAFLVRRGEAELPPLGGPALQGTSVISGYPWFADSGRGSMIALRGLSVCTGRPQEGLAILETLISALRGGLIPNLDDGAGTGDNTIDGALWLATHLEPLLAASQDAGQVRRALTILRGILRHHARGTGHGSGMDNADGLLIAGTAGSQLTWMDAKIHGWVVTPRHGKPIEIQALWLAALDTEQRLSGALGEQAEFSGVQRAARQAFGQFWNPENGYFYDVLHPAERPNAQVRPNALLALALPGIPATYEQRRSVLAVAARELLTPLGLRTLSPNDAAYRGNSGSDPLLRSAAYHQGTVWPWLSGAYTDLLLAQGQVAEARAALSGLLGHLWEAGLGSISEVMSPETLHPGGCPFQAWSVAEVLRAHIAICQAERPAASPLAPVATPLSERPVVTADPKVEHPSLFKLTPDGLDFHLNLDSTLDLTAPELADWSAQQPISAAHHITESKPNEDDLLLVVAPDLGRADLSSQNKVHARQLDDPFSVEDLDVIEPLT